MLIVLVTTASIVLIALLGLHLGFRAPRVVEQGGPLELGLPLQAARIATGHGKQLFAWHLPTACASTTVVIQHGWGGNAEMMLPLAVPFFRAGFNVLLADARNHGRSDSDGHSSLPRFAEDVVACVDWLMVEHAAQARRIVLVGHSVGAAAVMLAASGRKDISAVISISAFAHPRWMISVPCSAGPCPISSSRGRCATSNG